MPDATAPNDNSLPEKVRLAREKLGMSREQLAGEAGVSYKTVERLEAGTAVPRRATLKVITDVLDEAERTAA